MTRSWLSQRVKNVSYILNEIGDLTKEAAWVVGTFVLVVGYPLALSILDERVVQEYV